MTELAPMNRSREDRVMVNIALPPAVVVAIDRRADDEMISRTAWIRRLLAQAVRPGER